MDAESRHSSHDSPQSADHAPEISSSLHHSDRQEMHCVVCWRAFSLETEVNEGFEGVSICRDCKLIVLDDNETSVSRRNFRWRRRQRGRIRYRSSESVEDLFSQQFSQLISLVRQNTESQVDGDTAATVQQPVRYHSAQGRSRRWRRTYSDNDSDGIDHMDSPFGGSDSNISLGGYGGDSDVSLDAHSILDREMFIQVDNESHIYTDTDIDPMHAGLDQWISDEEDGEWEEADIEDTIGFMEPGGQIQDANNSPFDSGGWDVQNGARFSWRMWEDGNGQNTDIFADIEELEIIPPHVWNSGDYLDARGFEELLEQLAETDGSRRGAPPAAASFVESLPRVVISKNHEKHGSLICAVCKDPLSIDTEANQLPCLHLYHPSCIMPWLSGRNSCPVCRFELPTDDPDYEEGKRNRGRSEFHETRQQDPVEESSSEISSDTEVDEAHEFSHVRVEQGDAECLDHVVPGSNRGGGRGWLFLAAAPIISIVGIGLVMWFRSTLPNGRIHCREQDRQQLQRSRGTSTPAGRNRRWWSLF